MDVTGTYVVRVCCGVMVRMGDDEVGVGNHMPPFSFRQPADDDDAELRQRGAFRE